MQPKLTKTIPHITQAYSQLLALHCRVFHKSMCCRDFDLVCNPTENASFIRLRFARRTCKECNTTHHSRPVSLLSSLSLEPSSKFHPLN